MATQRKRPPVSVTQRKKRSSKKPTKKTSSTDKLTASKPPKNLSRKKTASGKVAKLPEIQSLPRATPLQMRDGYLSRLRRLLRLRRDHFEELNEQGLRLLDRSIFAAYCDCLDIGQKDAARQILKDVRLTLSMPRSSQKK